MKRGRPFIHRLQNDSASFAMDDDLVLIVREAARPGQADGLATAVAKQFGACGHTESIDYSLYVAMIHSMPGNVPTSGLLNFAQWFPVLTKKRPRRSRRVRAARRVP